MTTYSPKGKRIGRPPKPPQVETVEDDGLTMRFRALMARAASVMERRMDDIESEPSSNDNAIAAAELGNEAGVMLGQTRRHDESLRSAAKKVTPAMVTAALRAMNEEQREHILDEWRTDKPRESSLS